MSQNYPIRLLFCDNDYAQYEMIDFEEGVQFEVKMICQSSMGVLDTTIKTHSNEMTFVAAQLSICDHNWENKLVIEDPIVWDTTRKKIHLGARECGEYLYVYDDNDEVAHLYVVLELKLMNVTIEPMINPSPRFFVVTVGKNYTSDQMCLVIPAEILHGYHGSMPAKLIDNMYVDYGHLDRTQLVNVANLFIVHTPRFREIFDFSPEKQYQLGLLYRELLTGSDRLYGSILQPFDENYKSMRKVACDTHFERIQKLLLPIPDHSTVIWISSSDLQIPQSHTLSWFPTIWELQTACSKYGEEKYFSCLLTHAKLNECHKWHLKETRKLIHFDVKLVFIGNNGQTLEFYLSNQSGDWRFGLGCPTLVKISVLDAIGLNTDGIRLVVMAGNFRDAIEFDPRVVTFAGVTDYTIVTKKMTININKDVLITNSQCFNARCNGFFFDNGGNTCDVNEDDPEALVLVLEMMYGSAFPLDFSLLTRLMIVANKHIFTDIMRFFDLILVHLVSTYKLPQSWFNGVNELISAFNLHQLEDHIIRNRITSQRYVSRSKPEESHRKMLLWLNENRHYVKVPPSIEEIFGDWYQWNFENEDFHDYLNHF